MIDGGLAILDGAWHALTGASSSRSVWRVLCTSARGLVSQPAAIAVLVGLITVGVALGPASRQRARSLLERVAAGFAILRAPAAFVTRVLSWKVVARGLRPAAIDVFLVPAAPLTALAVVAA